MLCCLRTRWRTAERRFRLEEIPCVGRSAAVRDRSSDKERRVGAVQLNVTRGEDDGYDLFCFSRTTRLCGRIEQYEERLAQSEEESRSKTTFPVAHVTRDPYPDERHDRHAGACAADSGSAGSAHDERQPCDHPQSSRMVPWDIGGAVCLCAMELTRTFLLWHAERRRRRMSIEERVRQSQKLIFKLISSGELTRRSAGRPRRPIRRCGHAAVG